jgi:D-amino-acid oxidase
MGRSDVLVIGAGVIGLTTAVCLAEAGARVRVLSRDPLDATTSAAAGAVWAPYRIGGNPARIGAWSRRSLEVFTALSRVPRSGVHTIVSLEVGHRDVAAPEWASLTPGARPCLSEELPAGYSHGYRFVLPAIDMPVYLAYLLGRLERAGGGLQQQTVSALDEVRDAASVVINCAGMGARDLANDPTVRPVRGQLVVVANPGVRVGLVEAEDDEDAHDLTFLIPHGETLILGGTAEPDNHHAEPDPATAEAILARCARLDPRVAGAPVLDHRVGFRPERPEVRVSTEPGSGGRLWHNYGHGGAGVTLSWGCAETLTANVVRSLQTGTPVDQ